MDLGPVGSPLTSSVLRVRWLVLDEPDDRTTARLAESLDPGERSRARRFSVAHDRSEFIHAHALARAMLQRETGQPARRQRFRRTGTGKPALRLPPDAAPVDFSLSHTRGLVACAVTHRGNVGVDVERVVPDAPGLDGLTAFFAPEERAGTLRLPLPDRVHRIYRLWTLKEAFAKSAGEGVLQHLASARFELEPLRLASGAHRDGPWRFWESAPTGAHALALALTDYGAPEPYLDLRATSTAEVLAALEK
jgi:4'-phosphopantetheinyl transferase